MPKAEEVSQAKKTGAPVLVTGIQTFPPNSAGGVSVRVHYVNISDSTLKYVSFELLPFNAVGDVQASEIHGRRVATIQDVGPINPGDGNGVSPWKTMGTWNNVWYNRSIKCSVISRVEVEYMDGGAESFSDGELADLLASDVKNTCDVV